MNVSSGGGRQSGTRWSQRTSSDAGGGGGRGSQVSGNESGGGPGGADPGHVGGDAWDDDQRRHSSGHHRRESASRSRSLRNGRVDRGDRSGSSTTGDTSHFSKRDRRGSGDNESGRGGGRSVDEPESGSRKDGGASRWSGDMNQSEGHGGRRARDRSNGRERSSRTGGGRSPSRHRRSPSGRSPESSWKRESGRSGRRSGRDSESPARQGGSPSQVRGSAGEATENRSAPKNWWEFEPPYVKNLGGRGRNRQGGGSWRGGGGQPPGPPQGSHMQSQGGMDPMTGGPGFPPMPPHLVGHNQGTLQGCHFGGPPQGNIQGFIPQGPVGFQQQQPGMAGVVRPPGQMQPSGLPPPPPQQGVQIGLDASQMYGPGPSLTSPYGQQPNPAGQMVPGAGPQGAHHIVNSSQLSQGPYVGQQGAPGGPVAAGGPMDTSLGTVPPPPLQAGGGFGGQQRGGSGVIGRGIGGAQQFGRGQHAGAAVGLGGGLQQQQQQQQMPQTFHQQTNIPPPMASGPAGGMMPNAAGPISNTQPQLGMSPMPAASGEIASAQHMAHRATSGIANQGGPPMVMTGPVAAAQHATPVLQPQTEESMLLNWVEREAQRVVENGCLKELSPLIVTDFADATSVEEFRRRGILLGRSKTKSSTRRSPSSVAWAESAACTPPQIEAGLVEDFCSLCSKLNDDFLMTAEAKDAIEALSSRVRELVGLVWGVPKVSGGGVDDEQADCSATGNEEQRSNEEIADMPMEGSSAEALMVTRC